jgi:hypothetical protein
MIDTYQQQQQQYSSKLAQLAAGNFYIVPHALKRFRVRVVKKTRDKAEAFLRELIIKGAARTNPAMHVYWSIQNSAWTGRVYVAPYSFDVAFREGNDGSGRLAVVTVIDTPDGTSRLNRYDMNRRISLKEHLDMQENYEEIMMDLEDEIYDLKRLPKALSEAALTQQLNQAQQAGIEAGAGRMRERISQFLAQVADSFEAEDISSSELIRQLNGYVVNYPLEPEEAEEETQ